MILDDVKVGAYKAISKIVAPEVVIYISPNAPRPVLPYWTIKINSTKDVGMRAGQVAQMVDGNYFVNKSTEATLTVERYGINSVDVVHEFASAILMPGNREAFKSQNITTFDIHPVQDLTELLDGSQFEERGSVDLMIRFGTQITEPGNWIEKVVAKEEKGN